MQISVNPIKKEILEKFFIIRGFMLNIKEIIFEWEIISLFRT